MNASAKTHRLELAPLPTTASIAARNGALPNVASHDWGPGRPKHDHTLITMLWRQIESPIIRKVQDAYQKHTGLKVSFLTVARFRPDDIPAAEAGRKRAGTGGSRGLVTRKATPRRFKMPEIGSVAPVGPPIALKAPVVPSEPFSDTSAVLAELDAIRAIVALLAPLEDARARARVVAWLAARFASDEGSQG